MRSFIKRFKLAWRVLTAGKLNSGNFFGTEIEVSEEDSFRAKYEERLEEEVKFLRELTLSSKNRAPRGVDLDVMETYIPPRIAEIPTQVSKKTLNFDPSSHGYKDFGSAKHQLERTLEKKAYDAKKGPEIEG